MTDYFVPASAWNKRRQYVESQSCFCTGPQNGQPVCPCRMVNVKIIDGRYVEQKDLGPVVPMSNDTSNRSA